MIRIVSIALIIGGVVLLAYGINASRSFGSDVSRAVTGAPTDKTVWFFVGGGAALVAGLAGTLGGAKSR